MDLKNLAGKIIEIQKRNIDQIQIIDTTKIIEMIISHQEKKIPKEITKKDQLELKKFNFSNI